MKTFARASAAIVLAGVLIVGCKDKQEMTGPTPDRTTTLRFTPVFESPHAAAVAVEEAHLEVTRVSSGAVVVDTTFAVTADIFTSSQAVTVQVTFSGDSEVFEGVLTIRAGGQAVFVSDAVRVTGAATAPDPVDVILRYVGPGSQATGVAFSGTRRVGFFGDTLVLQASGSDANGPVQAPIIFASLDTTLATVPDPSNPTVVAGMQRGEVGITATLLTGQADTITVVVQPPPAGGGVTAGDNQTAEVGSSLNPIMLQVTGADSAGVEGALVVFSGDGAFAPESVVTDSLGNATTVWTLSTAAGTQTGTATVSESAASTAPGGAITARAGVTVTFTAVAVPAAPARLGFSRQPMDADAGLPILPEVEIRDTHGNVVVADSATAVTFAILAGTGSAGASLLGTNPVTANGGLVQPADLAVDLVGADYRIVASATGLAPDTSGTFSIAAGAIATIGLSPAIDTVRALGDSVVFTPTARDANGNVLSGIIYTWTSSDSTVAIPNAAGYAVAQGNGGATITAAAGGVNGTASVVVQQTVSDVTVTPSAPTLSALGDTTRFAAAITDANGNAVAGAAAAWTVADTTVATIDANGLATAQGNGATQVIALAGGVADTVTLTVGQVATHLVFSTEPVDATAGDTIPVAVEARDALGNVVTGFTGNVTIGFGANPGGATLTGTAVVAAASGVATFADLWLDAAATGYTFTASSAGLSPDTSVSFDITPGAAASLAFSTQPVNSTAGATIPLEVRAFDAHGNLATGFAGNIDLTFDNNPTGATLGGTTTVTAAGGIAAYTDISVDLAGSGYTLAATSGGLNTTSNAFDVAPAAAASLVFATEPVTSVAGAAIPMTVEARDGQGNVDTGFTGNVTLTFDNNPSGATLGGTTTVAAVAGVATFTDVTVDLVGTGYTLTATAGALNTTSQAFDITPGAAASLGFTTEPVTSVAGTVIPMEVTARDGQGNVDTGFTGNVTLTFDNNPSGATLGGTTTVAAVAGVATFTDVTVDLVGTGYTLTATAGALNTTSQAFDITPGAAASLVFTTQPVTSTAGATIPMTVEARDGQGNVDTNFSGNVQLTLGGGTAGASLNGTTLVAAVNGVASFTTVSVDSVGTNYEVTATAGALNVTSTQFDITPGAAASLVFTTQPVTSTAGATIPMTVEARDGQGNVDTSFSGNVQLTLGGGTAGASLNGTTLVAAVNGVASFTTVSVDSVGTNYEVTATAGALNVTSTQFDVTPGAAASLQFTTQPVTSAAGAVIPMEVTARDGQGNVDTNFSGNVQLTLGGGTAGASLNGTTLVAAVNGVASFTTVSVDSVGTNYEVTATAGALNVTSTQFDITPGAAASLVFTTQPVTSMAGATIPMTVEARDGQGNVDTSFSGNVQLTLGGGTAGASLNGTTLVAAVNGVASFTTVSVDSVGTNYEVTATAGALNVTSTQFDVTPGAAASLQFTTQPVTSAAGAVIPMEVTARDGQGNVDTNFSGNVQLTLGGGTAGASLNGTTLVAAVNGVASFTTVSVDSVGTNYEVTATAGALNVTSTQFDITPGAAASLVFTTQPVTSMAGATIPMTVEARDGQGNVDTSFSGNVQLTLGGGTAGASLNGTTLVAAVNGVASFTTVSVDSVGTNYEVTATAGALNVTSTQFDVTPGAAASLQFTTQPVTSAAGAVIPMEVTARDGQGNVDTNFSGNVQLALGGGTAGASLNGTTLVAAVNGVASFTTVSVDSVGTNYEVTATAGALNVTSTQFDVTPGAAASLEFTTQPATSAAGDTIPMVVTARDGQGNVDTNFSGNVQLTLGGGTAGASLNGTTLVAAVNGVATYSDVYLDSAGTAYEITATSGALNVTSNQFDITAGALANIALSPAADTIRAIGDSVLYTPTATDAFGNVITGLAYTWATVDSSIAVPDVLGAGYALAVSNGSTTISATSGGVTGNATVEVEAGLVSWIGGAAGSWNDVNNWSTGALPTATDTVLLDAPGNVTVTLDISTTIAELRLGDATGVQQLDLAASNTLTITDGGTIGAGGVLNQAGTVSLGAALTVNGTHNWTSGTLTGAGSTDVQPGGTLALSGNGLKILDGHTVTTTGSGQITLSGAGNLQADNDPTITNNGTFDIQSDADLVQGGSSGTLNSGGTLRKSGGGGTSNVAWTVNNTNQVTVQAAAGTLSLDGGGAHTGAFTADGGLNFGAGTHTLSGAVSGTGSFGVSGDSVTVSNSYAVATTNVTGGTLILNTAAAATTTAFTQSGGTLAGSAALEIGGAADWSGGNWEGAGSTDVTGTGALTISGTTARTLDQRTVNNSGTVTVTGAMVITVDNNAVINNLAGGTFDAQAAASVTPTVALDGAFNNSGKLTRTAGGGAFTLDVPFTSTDTVDVQAGTLRLNGGDDNTPITGVLVLTGDTLAFGGGGTALYRLQDSVVGTGTISVVTAGTDVQVNGYYQVGTTHINAATLQFNNTLPDTAVTDTLWSLNGAVIQGAGVIAVADTGLWDGGTWWTGTTYIMPTAHLTIGTRPTKSLNSGRTFDVAGTVTFPAGGGGDLIFNTNSVLNVQAAGTFDLQGNRNLLAGGNPGTANVQNAGTLRRSTAGTSSVTVPLTNTGTGTVDIIGGTLAPTSTLTHNAGGTVQGGDTLDLTLATVSAFDGDIHPGATGTVDTLSVDITGGTLTLGNSSRIHVDIVNALTDHDRLDVTGTIDVTNATIDVDVTGIVLTTGDAFTIVTGTTAVTGTPTIGTVTGHAAGFTVLNVGGTSIVITAN